MRRICLVGAAVAVSSLALGVASPSAKTHKTHKKTVPKEAATVTISSTCRVGLTLAIPAGATDVTPPVDSGQMFGPESCSGLGSGLVSYTFSTADSGDFVGPLTQILPSGGLTGSLDLAESSSLPPTPYVFGNVDLTGTLKITGGLGPYKKAKGTATFVCTSPDSLHYVCLEKAKFKIPNPA